MLIVDIAFIAIVVYLLYKKTKTKEPPPPKKNPTCLQKRLTRQIIDFPFGFF